MLEDGFNWTKIEHSVVDISPGQWSQLCPTFKSSWKRVEWTMLLVRKQNVIKILFSLISSVGWSCRQNLEDFKMQAKPDATLAVWILQQFNRNLRIMNAGLHGNRKECIFLVSNIPPQQGVLYSLADTQNSLMLVIWWREGRITPFLKGISQSLWKANALIKVIVFSLPSLEVKYHSTN